MKKYCRSDRYIKKIFGKENLLALLVVISYFGFLYMLTCLLPAKGN